MTENKSTKEALSDLLIKYLSRAHGIEAMRAEFDHNTCMEDWSYNEEYKNYSYGTVLEFYINYRLAADESHGSIKIQEDPLAFLARELLPLEDNQKSR